MGKQYGGPSRIVGDIINNLSRKSKPVGGSRKEKFVFYSVISGAIQRLERLSQVNYIYRAELETCLLFRVQSLGPRDDNHRSGLQEPCGYGDIYLFQKGVCY